MKYIKFKRYKFSTIGKNISSIRYNFLKFFKFINLYRYELKNFYKHFDYKKYSFYRIDKKINLKHYKHLPIYFVIFFIFAGFTYVAIPLFYNFDKSQLEKSLCGNQNIECSVRGGINYSFYPTPRIKIKDLIINNNFGKKKTLIKAEEAAIEIALKDLLYKEKHKFKKMKLRNFEINFNLKDFKYYKKIFTKKNISIPVSLQNGKIIFLEDKDYIASIINSNINLKLKEKYIDTLIDGYFLNDKIHIKFENKAIDNTKSTNVVFKMSKMNLLAKTNFLQSSTSKDVVNGNILLKKGKNKITAIFDYKDNKLNIIKSNLRNTFLDGKMQGEIKILPYFNFDLDINLNSVNFTKLYNAFLSLDNKSRKELFKVNEKVNGNINLSADKIYSNYSLMKSFESRLKFNNSNILIEQFLINLGKLGAADFLGSISNDKKFTIFKFETNIFVDNQKKFLSKMGIYNKENIPSSFFVSGNFDLENTRASIYEISNEKKLNNEDINFIEKEFNDLMLEEGYQSLFNFNKFKVFIKSITGEEN